MLLLLVTMLASAAPLDLSMWKYRKRIPVTPGDGLAVVKLDREVYAAIGDRAWELRVLRDQDEVPFVFNTPGQEEDHVVEPTEMFNRVLVPSVGIQFTMHSKGGARYTKINLGTDQKNFRKRVRIETSADGKRWAIARDNGAIFNFSQDGHEFSSTTVEFPASRQPYFRVTVFGWLDMDSVKDATLDWDFTPATPKYEVLATLNPQIDEDTATKSTVVTVDMGLSGLPTRRFVLESQSPQFHRAVGIETSDDGKGWSYSTQGTIRRLPGPEFTDESLDVPAPSHQRYIRFRIYNRDDKPIQIGRVQAEGLVHRIKFLAATQGSYWLYYGNPGVSRMPEYDLELVLARQTFREITWTLGPAQNNPAYRPPAAPKKPWSEQHPAILYTVLGVAVLGLGGATLRFMARLRTSS
jgi:hypothetical protein